MSSFDSPTLSNALILHFLLFFQWLLMSCHDSLAKGRGRSFITGRFQWCDSSLIIMFTEYRMDWLVSQHNKIQSTKTKMACPQHLIKYFLLARHCGLSKSFQKYRVKKKITIYVSSCGLVWVQLTVWVFCRFRAPVTHLTNHDLCFRCWVKINV